MGTLDKYYKILELPPDASLSDVNRSYKDLVRVWHPDRFAGDPRMQEKTEEKLKEINIAYQNIVASYKFQARPSAGTASDTTSKQLPPDEAVPYPYAHIRSFPFAFVLCLLGIIVGMSMAEVVRVYIGIDVTGMKASLIVVCAILGWMVGTILIGIINGIYIKRGTRVKVAALCTVGLFSLYLGVLISSPLVGFTDITSFITKSAGNLHIKHKDKIFADFNEIVEAINSGDHEKVIDELSKVIKSNPQSPDYYYYRALEYEKIGENDSALADFERAIRLNPENEKYYICKGKVCLKAGKYRQGIQNYKIAATLGSKEARQYLRIRNIDWTKL